MNRGQPWPARRVDLTFRTFVRAAAVVALVWCWLRLWRWVLVAVIGAALAVALNPAVRWLERRGVRRWIAAPGLVLGGTAGVLTFFALAAAALRSDARLLEQRVLESAGWLQSVLPPSAEGALGSFMPTSETFLLIGQVVVGGLAAIAVALVLTVYFLLDGRRTYEWLVALAPRDRQPKVRETAEGACEAMAAYVRGNLITSALSAVATWIALALMGVPASLLLGVLAGVCDLLPVIGILLSAAPAILLALTVSPTTAVLVAVFFVAYNAVENYYIQPKVYGRALRISDLAVIAAFLAGAELGGVLGALVALPLAAIYPVVERVWLRRDLAQAHERIEAEPAR